MNRYSFSALPRRILYWTSGDRWPIWSFDHGDAVRPCGVGVGIVGLAHDVVFADLVDAGDPVGVVDEAAEHVITEQFPDIELIQVHIRGGVLHELHATSAPRSVACRAPVRLVPGSTASSRSLPPTVRSSPPGSGRTCH